jgi:hypothetical protein
MIRPLSALLAASLFAGSASAQQSKPQFLDSLADLSVYTKPRFDSPYRWDEAFGLRAKLARYGNASAEFSIAYDPYLPIKYSIDPKWTSGIQFAYFFTKAPFPIGIYTTPKFNLINVWSQEFGLNLRLLNTRRVYVNSSIDDQITYPFVHKAPPTFQASLTVGFPLGG